MKWAAGADRQGLGPPVLANTQTAASLPFFTTSLITSWGKLLNSSEGSAPGLPDTTTIWARILQISQEMLNETRNYKGTYRTVGVRRKETALALAVTEVTCCTYRGCTTTDNGCFQKTTTSAYIWSISPPFQAGMHTCFRHNAEWVHFIICQRPLWLSCSFYLSILI